MFVTNNKGSLLSQVVYIGLFIFPGAQITLPFLEKVARAPVRLAIVGLVKHGID